MLPTLLDHSRATRLLFLLGCAVLLTHAVTTATAPAAKKKAQSVRIAAPATGQANVAFGTVKLKKHAKAPKVKVASAPAGVVASGAVSSKGRIAIAVAKPGGGAGARAAAAGDVVVKLTGRG